MDNIEGLSYDLATQPKHGAMPRGLVIVGLAVAAWLLVFALLGSMWLLLT